MEPLRLTEIATATAGTIVWGSDVMVPGITIDTRSLRPGELYIAIKGKRFDGHEFIGPALAAGALGVVVSKWPIGPVAQVPKGAVVLKVADTRQALQQIATFYRSKLTPRAVAITGSNGKTTTKELLAAILSRRFKVVKAEGSYNNDIGVPLTVLRLERDTEAAVFEIEMNELGGTRRLARVCQPQVGVITNIGDTHLEFLKNREGVAQEKAELLESLPRDGVAVLNADDPIVMELGARCGLRQRLTFGLEQPADVVASRVVEYGLRGVAFLLQGKYEVRLGLFGRHNVANCLAACAAAHAVGMSFAEMPAALAGFTALPMRLSVKLLKGVTLIDDCYNANPQSVVCALDVLSRNAEPKRRVAILGDMLELGSESGRLHEAVGRRAGSIVDRLILVGSESEHTAAGALAAGLNPARLWRFDSSAAVGKALFDIIRPGDTILVKGSRALSLEVVVQQIVSHYG